jgi:hypothetical protein
MIFFSGPNGNFGTGIAATQADQCKMFYALDQAVPVHPAFAVPPLFL